MRSTPEMKIFLDQLGVLGCRLVDAMASGKTKEFIQNSKDLVWRTIELAVDPSTTLALAEVTAHLCHALEEVGDDSSSFKTPRSVRNSQNETTYLDSSLMTTDYPFESMEKIILSSLGMGDNNNNNNNNNNINYDGIDIVDDIDDDETAEQSIPSNVAFQVEGGRGATLGSLYLEQNDNKKDDNSSSHLEKCKASVDLELLQEKILYEGRPRARPPLGGSSVYDNSSTRKRIDGVTNQQLQQQRQLPVSILPSTNASLSSSIKINSNDDNNNDTENKEHRSRSAAELFEEDFIKIEEDMEELPTSPDDPLDFKFRDRTTTTTNRHPNLKELYDKFETMETKELENPSFIQFYNAIDDLIGKKRREKRRQHQAWAAETACDDDDENLQSCQDRGGKNAKVRKFRKGIMKEEKSSSKAIKEKYTHLRRLWNYPPSLLRMSALAVVLVCFFWIGFGIYGMYTFFHRVVYFGQETVLLPNNSVDTLPPVQQQPNYGFDHGRDMTSPNMNNYDNHGYDERSYNNNNNSRPNEIVIRIVKEVVHVREDGSRIENYNNANDESVISDFSQEEIDRVKECMA